jgi:MFS family permease
MMPGGVARWVRYAGLGYALAVLLAGTNMPTPLYAGYERAYRLSPFDVTLLVAVYAGAVIIALLVCGPLSDAVGYRWVLAAALAAAAAGAGLLAAASGPGWLFAGRAVQGLAVGSASGALTAGLVLTEPRGRRARASLLAAIATTAACGAGPVLAGALAQFAPRPHVLCYLVEIGLLLPAIAVAATLPGSLGRAGQRWRPRRPRVPPAIRGEFLLPAVVSLLAWAVAYVTLALVPSYTATALSGTRLGANNLLIDGSAAGSLLLCAAAAQAVFRSLAPRRAAAAGLALLVIGLLGLILAGAAGSAALLFATIAVTGAGQGLAFAGSVRQINDLAPPAERAATVAMFYVVTYAGSGLATAGVGLLASQFGLVASVRVFAVMFAAASVAMLAVVVLTRERALTGTAGRLRSP